MTEEGGGGGGRGRSMQTIWLQRGEDGVREAVP